MPIHDWSRVDASLIREAVERGSSFGTNATLSTTLRTGKPASVRPPDDVLGRRVTAFLPPYRSFP